MYFNHYEIDCTREQILAIIIQVTSMEHPFPEWTGINKSNNSVVVGFEFTIGRLETGKHYKFDNGKFIEK